MDCQSFCGARENASRSGTCCGALRRRQQLPDASYGVRVSGQPKGLFQLSAEIFGFSW